MTDFNLVVRVLRDSAKGWHWIDKAKYEADPSAYVLVDDSGTPVEQPKADPLDHDNDGNKGGTKAAPKNPELAALRKQYKEKFGKGTSPKWDADTIRGKLAEAPQE